MRARALVIGLAIAAAAYPAGGAAGSGGPSPGFSWGGQGIAVPGGQVHYVAVGSARDTVVEAVGSPGNVLRFGSFRGVYGIPLVANDGELGGLTRDGRILVLASNPGVDNVTRFALVKTSTLQIGRTISLRGQWAFDALSPDGRTLYLIQYFLKPSSQRYLVRAYDLTRGRLFKQAVSDRTEKGLMTGWPVTRTTSRDGAWAYTLYMKGNGAAFIHALDTAHRKAVCVDLPWKHTQSWISDARLRLSSDGTKLYLRQLGAYGRTAVVDTRSWKVKVSSTL